MMLREWDPRDVVVSQKLFADLIGKSPSTFASWVDRLYTHPESEPRLVPDRLSLAFKSEAFSLSYFLAWCEENGYPVPWEEIDRRVSQAGGILRR